MAYADEKFSRAVYLLATLPGGIHERLIHVYLHEIGDIEPERDVPQPLIHDFDLLTIRMVSQDPAMGGTHDERIHATVHAMSQSEAVEVVRQILSLAHHLERTPSHADAVNEASTSISTISTTVSGVASTRKHLYSLHTFPFHTAHSFHAPNFFDFNKK